MAPRRAPDERGPFLGTEQIIRRLREVRQPLWRSHLNKTALVTLCGSALVLALVVIFDRASHSRLAHGPASRAGEGLQADVRIDSRADADGSPVGDAVMEPAEPDARAVRRAPAERRRARVPHEISPEDADEQAAAGGLDAWSVDDDDQPPPPPRRRRGVPARAPAVAAAVDSADDPTTTARVRIEVRGGPGSIFIDGKRVALDRNWETDLSHGEHYLMVRLGGRSMTYKLKLRGAGVKVVFDDAHSRIREESWPPRPASP